MVPSPATQHISHISSRVTNVPTHTDKEIPVSVIIKSITRCDKSLSTIIWLPFSATQNITVTSSRDTNIPVHTDDEIAGSIITESIPHWCLFAEGVSEFYNLVTLQTNLRLTHKQRYTWTVLGPYSQTDRHPSTLFGQDFFGSYGQFLGLV